MSFDFHRLNILLLRSSTDKSCTIPTREVNLKLATATLSGARIDAQVGDILDLQVVLGGLQVTNKTNSKGHQNSLKLNLRVLYTCKTNRIALCDFKLSMLVVVVGTTQINLGMFLSAFLRYYTISYYSNIVVTLM